MTFIDTTGDDAKPNAELFFNFFNSNHENLSTGCSQLVEFDKYTAERDRTLQATQVVDCIVVAIWGKTKDGKDFISLVHKSGPSRVEKLITEFIDILKEAKLAYLVIPGSESGDRIVKETREECENLFRKNEKIDSMPELKIIKNDRRNNKTAVAIKGQPNNVPSILLVRPNFGY